MLHSASLLLKRTLRRFASLDKISKNSRTLEYCTPNSWTSEARQDLPRQNALGHANPSTIASKVLTFFLWPKNSRVCKFRNKALPVSGAEGVATASTASATDIPGFPWFALATCSQTNQFLPTCTVFLATSRTETKPWISRISMMPCWNRCFKQI